MEKGRSSAVISIIALIIAVVGLSIGFAAFSSTLTISTTANVSPDSSKFDVNFSSSETSELDGNVVPTLTPSDVSADVLSASTATIDNSSEPKITNLKAFFTEPNQTVTYSFFAHNAGEYKAFLNAVSFANVNGKNSTKVCTPEEGTDETMVANACESISIDVKVGSTLFTGSDADIDGHTLDIDGYEPVVVTIKYEEGATIADGDFSVDFGDITLLYKSVD